ncbi:ARHGEF37 [Bugula neritina]|uniref:ARHGEF37 n=1 Tax=Bugula neritina TaxID=10212 RepID=A0A7J7IYJ0_BUGNE|nr:ARHGEF37 [Bugula neritina]
MKEEYAAKSRRSPTDQRELKETKKNFDALSGQLKLELPRFNSLAKNLFRDCVCEFTRHFKIYCEESYSFTLPIQGLPVIFDCSDVVSQFERRHSLVAGILTKPNGSLNTNPFKSTMPTQVFKSRYDFLSRNAQELSLKANQIVYILEKHDKLGNRDWWYAQTSDGYGYVPANYLTPQN